MKHVVLLLVTSSFAVACVQGEIGGGEPGPSGAAGLPILTGAAGNAQGGAAGGGAPGGGAGMLTGGARVTGGAGTGTSSTSGSGTGTAGTGAAVTGAAGTGMAGSGAGGTGAAGTGSATGAAGTGVASCSPSGIPGDVAAVISVACVACHGNTPVQGVPSSMTTYAQLTAPAVTDPTKSVAAVALARMQSTDMTKQMPPPPLARATAAQIAPFQAWVSAGTPKATCTDAGVAPPPDGGAPSDAGGIVDPFAVAPVCTSKTMWTRNNSGSDSMNPGLACINCHTSMKRGPSLTIAGTIYPTAHEPDLCNGGAVTTSARIVITGADKQTVTLTPNNAGNFRYSGALAKPYTVKVTYMGRERAMLEPQTSGDCNGCHTQNGTMKAPGRVLLP